MPFLGRETASAPSKPASVKMESGKLKWSTENQNDLSVVYYFSDKTKKGEVVDIFKGNEIAVSAEGFYCVSTLNSDNKESEVSELIALK